MHKNTKHSPRVDEDLDRGYIVQELDMDEVIVLLDHGNVVLRELREEQERHDWRDDVEMWYV